MFTGGAAKVSDFGCSRKSNVTESLRKTNAQAVRTIAYLAPEGHEEHQFTAAGDVYAFGVIINEVVTGLVPWKGSSASQVVLKACKGLRPRVPLSAEFDPPALKALMQKCWAQDPAERPGVDAIVRELQCRGSSSRLRDDYCYCRCSQRRCWNLIYESWQG